jgi:hypothetical protein
LIWHVLFKDTISQYLTISRELKKVFDRCDPLRTSAKERFGFASCRLEEDSFVSPTE